MFKQLHVLHIYYRFFPLDICLSHGVTFHRYSLWSWLPWRHLSGVYSNQKYLSKGIPPRKPEGTDSIKKTPNSQVAHWLSTRTAKWPTDSVPEQPSGPLTPYQNSQVAHWLSTRTVKWPTGSVPEQSSDPLTQYQNSQVAHWLYTRTAKWPTDSVPEQPSGPLT